MNGGLWESDALIANLRPAAAPWSPERRLVAALLIDALERFEVFAMHGNADQEQLDELTWWFFGSEPRWPFSFEAVCDHLGLEVGCVRERLLELMPPEAVRARLMRLRHSFEGRPRRRRGVT